MGMGVGVLVSVGGMGVNVSVGGGAVGEDVAEAGMKVWVGGAGSGVGGEALRLQAVSRKINVTNVRVRFIVYFFHSIKMIDSMSRTGSRVSLSLRPLRV